LNCEHVNTSVYLSQWIPELKAATRSRFACFGHWARGIFRSF